MRYVISIFCFWAVSFTFGQQTEHLTQYQFNQFNFNPAVAGTKRCIDIRSGYRYQWLGIAGAPNTGFVNGHGPIIFNRKKRNMYGPRHGAGLSINRDVFGDFSFLQFHLSYAFHIPLNMDWTLSFGAAIGLKQGVFDTNNITTEFEDPAIANIPQSFIVFPDGRFGMWLAEKNHYFGFSIVNLFGNRLESIGPETRLQRHVYITAGKQIKLEKSWTFTPSIFILKTGKTPFDFHLSALFNMDNKLSLGLGLRRTDAITAQIRVKLFNFLSIGYSFDYVISKLNKNMWYSHELTGGFNSCSNYGNSSTTSCPAFE